MIMRNPKRSMNPQRAIHNVRFGLRIYCGSSVSCGVDVCVVSIMVGVTGSTSMNSSSNVSVLTTGTGDLRHRGHDVLYCWIHKV
jgi:hypothetical protein